MEYIIFASIVAAANLGAIYLLWQLILRLLRAYLQPPDENTPAEWTKMVDYAAQRMVHTALESIKMSNLQARQVESRHEKGMEKAMMKDMAAQASPMLGAAAEMFPNLLDYVNRYPALAQAAQGLIARALANKEGPGSGPGGNSGASAGVPFQGQM